MLLFNLSIKNETSELIIDEKLFPEIADGNKQAFCTLYEECKGAVFAYAFSLLKNADKADDAVSDTFLKIRTSAHLYKPKGKPLAWIFTITKNICLMEFRKNKKLAETPIDDIRNLSALDKISDVEDRMVIKTALEILSEEECTIIFLHAVSGEKHREIADLLNLPLSTVISKYNRGIKKLRKELEEKL